MSDTPSFFQQRLAPLGVTPENNRITIVNQMAEFPAPKRYEAEIFSEDADGNIKILYWTLDRDLIQYLRHGDGKMSMVNAKPETYVVKRLKESKGTMKYQVPDGKFLRAEDRPAIYPWIPPELVDKWERKEKIPVLFVTEGVFKAWMGTKLGMDVVAFTSYTTYLEYKNGPLHRDLIRLMIDCEVETLVILWDGDCLNFKQSALDRREDLIERPLGFYAAAKKIRKKLQEIDLPTKPAVYFYHIISDSFPDKPKGLDDLLISAKEKGQQADVVKHANDPASPSPFFKKVDITETQRPLHEYFCLHDALKFYARHSGVIKDSDFKFNGDLYRYNEGKEELELIAPAWAENTYWIGDEFFRVIDVPSARKGTTRKELKPFNQGTLEKIYGNKLFWKFLEPFAGFCNVPSHFNYQQVIEYDKVKFYNRYFPFKHTPVKGEWPTILHFIKHIFGEEEVEHALDGRKIPRWQLGLDYVQILLQRPTQMLPVLILYSPENNTGKSTFGRLLSTMFGDNVVPIGNADLQSDFNETYADKLLAICEETLLDRKKDVERIKSLSTNPRILVNPKGQKQYQIDFFCKFIFMSNNRRMIYVTREDQRFWILQVPKFAKEIPNFSELMEAEVPAFIEHLSRRQMVTEWEGRMWFHPSLLHTDTFEDTVKVNEPSAASDLREAIREMFMHDKDMEEILIPTAELKKQFFGTKVSTGWIHEILSDYVRVEQLKGMDGKAKVVRGQYSIWETNNDGDLVRKDIKYIGRPYVFKRADFLPDENPDDYKEIEEQERQELAAKIGKPNGAAVESKPISETPPDDLPF